MDGMIRATAVLLTLFTGFTGLVYQVTWQKYLATLLGSHSEATAAVLGIFLGGLSLGYWIFGAASVRWSNRAQAKGVAPRLLLSYGLIEASIGVYALAFPWLFDSAMSISYLLPHGHPLVGFASDVLLAALLIGPPAVLMGATIPILTQSLSRNLEDASRLHALVYGMNTAGAVAGALAAGFFLVPALGLNRVLLYTGVVNLVAGGLYVIIGVRPQSIDSEPAESEANNNPENVGAYLVVALLLGFAMMTMETTLIRLAGLSFGSSQFTFSMVVAAFVLCIAIGGLAVSIPRSIPHITVPIVYWLLGIALFALYPVMQRGPYWVYVLRSAFETSAAGFYAYYLLGFLSLLMVIGIPVLLSGAALPLLFHHLRREFGQLGSLAGRLYSWNTIGSLLGALIGGYALFFWFDLHHIYRIAVAAVFVAATMLTLRMYSIRPQFALVVLPILAALVFQPAWNPQLLSLGLFRGTRGLSYTYSGLDVFLSKHGYASYPISFYDDGPTTSVAVKDVEFQQTPSNSLVVNGKVDGNTVGDYKTMALLGIIPALMADRVESAFIVGFGTGMTAAELASIKSIERMVIAEISPSVIAADTRFSIANRNILKSPKVEVIRSDGYRALTRNEEKFDLIISQPSNPWVTGVEMLFSREFLELAKTRLSPGGVYAQWFQRYETDERTIEMVLRTYASVFEYVSVWDIGPGDMVLLGFNEIGPAIDQFRLVERAGWPDYRRVLEQCQIDSIPSLLAHESVPIGVIHAAKLEAPIHTLYHPRLSDAAGRAFFNGGSGHIPFTGGQQAAAIGSKNSLFRRYLKHSGGDLSDAERISVVRAICSINGPFCETALASWLHDAPDSAAFQSILAMTTSIKMGTPNPIDADRVARLSQFFEFESSETEATSEADASDLTTTYTKFFHHAFPFDPQIVLDVWSRCREEPISRAECERRLRSKQVEMLVSDVGMGVDLTTLLEKCESLRTVGVSCQEGRDNARLLLE
jgi:spermidine synthase